MRKGKYVRKTRGITKNGYDFSGVRKKKVRIEFRLIMLTLLCLISLVSCKEKILSREEIQSNIVSQIVVYQANETISSFEIVKRNTNIDLKMDQIWCKVYSKDASTAYERQFRVDALLYDEGGWIVEQVTPYESTAWKQRPLKGVDLGVIRNSFYGKAINIADEQWSLTEIETLEILEQDTQLNSGVDIVTVKVTLSDELMSVSGNINLDYSYANGWVLKKLEEKDFSEPEYKSGKGPNVSIEEILDAVVSRDFLWKTSAGDQYVRLSRNTIDDFILTDCTHSEKGRKFVQNCSFRVTTPCVTLKLEEQVVYKYQNGEWKVESMSYSPVVEKVDITGVWHGEYSTSNDKMNVTLTIEKQGADGALSAIFSFSPPPTNTTGKSGSFRMHGGVDLKTLEVVLDATEWIEQPENYSYGNIRAMLSLNDQTISGDFKVKGRIWTSTYDIKISR